MANFQEWAKSHQQSVEEYLQVWLSDQLNGAPKILKEAMLYSLMAGGKRVRPLLVFAAVEALGGNSHQALPAAAAVECVHTYSLIHDDLPAMDDDDLRRGKPTSHKVFGEALAILAGDALLTLAFEILAKDYSSNPAPVLALALGAGPIGMVGGQVLDLIADGQIADAECDRDKNDQLFLKNIQTRKTGALFLASVRLGYEVACLEMSQIEEYWQNLEIYGNSFGQAFQITDDLLDLHSDEQTAGKKTKKDAGRGKLTYPGLIGIEQSELEAEKHFNRGLKAIEVFGEKASPLKDLLLALRNRKK
ncbi:polyprenyl synthetase family protein [Telmatocola sphagniphila]|uniref:Polyprenyl synthetase family protein n=1 Tax=Telmatocola sphagniphila TaxID=1123043 RepID=A0A8E6B720_9BACT|nr:farnesyl diphosphate synthase [Telmatocola sphagniphila]QVL33315.1 polyprenyl synthetase family protein [Telmatocola sphagniphila]